MPPKKKSPPAWQAFPGAQEVMDRAVPMVAPARTTRDFGPLAVVVFETALIFTNAEGRPDLRRESYATRQWMSSLLDAAGIKAPPMSPLDVREAAKRDRDSVLQSVRAAISPVRVNYVFSLDQRPEELTQRFPGFASSDEIFAYYKIIPKTQSEVRAETYQRRAALQTIGAAVLAPDGEVPPARCADVVGTVHRAVASLTPASFDGLAPETRDQLRQELSETRAALLALEDALS